MRLLYLDYETHYDAEYSLRRMTTTEYILDPRFETLGASVMFDDEQPQWIAGPDFAAWAEAQDWSQIAMVSHNITFDGGVLAFRYNKHPALYVDTLSMARALLQHKLNSLSLDSVARHLNLGVKGTAITLTKGVRFAQLVANPGLYQAFQAYAHQDNHLCREVYKRLKPLFPREEGLVADTIIRMFTQPQLQIDVGALNVHLQKVKRDKQALLDQLGFQDNSSLMSNDKFAEALLAQGVEPPRKISATTGKETWAFAKSDQGFKELAEHDDPVVQSLVAARLGHKSTLEETRTEKLIRTGLLYPNWTHERAPWFPIPLRYSGAHTHRLSGSDGLNCQNFPRGGEIRKAIRAPKGKIIVTADQSQIEARIVCWLAGAKMLDVFARGEDPYAYQAIQIGAMAPGLDKNDPLFKHARQLGKGVVLGCIAHGTEVLTDRGYVPIQNVSLRDKVWDGFEWVNHRGLLEKGLRETLQVSGVRLTPDHLVLCGAIWRQAQYVARDENILSRALEIGSANLPLQASSRESGKGWLRVLFSAAVARLSTSWCSIHSAGALPSGVTPVPASSRTSRARPTGATRTSFRTTPIACAFSIASLRVSTDVTTRPTATSSTMAGGGSRCMSHGAQIVARFLPIWPHWMGGITRSWISTALETREGTSRAIFGFFRALKTCAIGGLSTLCRRGSTSSKLRMPTYDLAFAGPRNCFTVRTPDGGHLVVHNCGFGMGPTKFQLTVARPPYNLNLSFEEAQRAVYGYRNTNPEVPRLWSTLQSGLQQLARNGETVYTSGRVELVRGLFYETDGRTVYVTLPCGLAVKYEDLHMEQGQMWFTYAGRRQYVYGGKATENLVQALARCTIMEAAVRVRRETEFCPALQVHDENVYVVPEEIGDDFKEVLRAAMTARPSWAPDLPVATEVGCGYNYGESK